MYLKSFWAIRLAQLIKIEIQFTENLGFYLPEDEDLMNARFGPLYQQFLDTK